MLRLDKTITRKVPLHYDQDAEDRARWQAMSFAEKRGVVWHLQQRQQELHAIREVGRKQDRRRNALGKENPDLSD